MTPIERARLAAMPLFAGVEGPTLNEIFAAARIARFGRDAAVFAQEEEAHSFFVLLEGRLRVTRLTPDGQQVVVRFVSAGDLFGIAPAVGRTSYPATATTIVESVVAAWPTAAWPRLLALNPAFAANALQTVGGRLQDAHTRVVELATEPVEQRIAHALLRLAERSGRPGADGVEIDFPLSRQDVAEMTGSTLHTVSRILSAWERDGIVAGGRRRIALRDRETLARIAEGAG
ncbi:Crp/Fnr family transcriptional regulator [Salinarimonas ramus]|uniref:Crp/Fnr family transcriptional regulator n=1 Tax=Salinarimonas ramus TaxID=690164 RepID=A0A917QHN4_9HYPH|nr:Crp/Fnr family transcriptional regulator [Salinarimonas ramus]GGK51256.1 Crp/Fnr family transcriptional regulator [Salinarimonas ramus]